MTTPYLMGDLRRDEGDVLHAYPDPLTHGPPWTDGVGHTGTDVTPDTVITEAQSRAQEGRDVGLVVAGIDRNLPWWRDMNDARQDVFVNIAFNIGLTAFLTFRTFLTFCKGGEFSHAGLDLLGTEAAHELPTRYRRLAHQMSSGVRQP